MKSIRELCAGALLLACAWVPLKADILLPDVNPRAGVKALGGSGAALRDSHISSAVNPASLALFSQGRFSLLYGNEPGNAHRVCTEFIYPFSRRGSLAGAAEAGYLDSFNYMQNYSFALSFQLFRWFSAGGTARVLQKTLQGESAEVFLYDAGIRIDPVSWLGLGLTGYSLNEPLMEYTDLPDEVFPMRLRGGISIFCGSYFNLTADMFADEIPQDLKDARYRTGYGIEIFPDPALALRGGISGSEWSAGIGILSEGMDFDYVFISGADENTHYFQYSRKFGYSPSRRELAVSEKETYLEREMLFLDAMRYFKTENISEALNAAGEYESRFGADKRIISLVEDINQWLSRMRMLNLGRAQVLSKEILRDYYAGKINYARIGLENAKLLAPHYEELRYLEHLISAREMLERGEFIQAEAQLVEALKLNPDSRDVISLYGRLREVIKLSEE